MEISILKLIAITTFTLFCPVTLGSTLTYGEVGFTSQLNPYQSKDNLTRRLATLLFSSLVSTDKSGNYIGDLAESWQIDPNSQSVSFRLKDSYWHSKKDSQSPSPVTWQDIKATILYARSKDEHALKVIKSIEKLSSNRFKVHFHRSLSDPLKHLMFKIIPSTMYNPDNESFSSDDFEAHPTGTGPYQFVKRSSTEITLKRHPRYHGQIPNIELIKVRVFPNYTILAQALMYDSLDLVSYISPNDLTEVSSDKDLAIIPYNALSFSFIGFNLRRPHLMKKDVRRAMSAAIDVQEMLRVFFKGNGSAISGPLPITSWAYNTNIHPVKFDPQYSSQILKKSGYQLIDGLWTDNKGGKLEFIFSVPIGDQVESIKKLALAYQSYLERAGFRINLQFVGWRLWHEKVINQQDFDLTMASWNFDKSLNIANLFHSQNADKGGYNFIGFKNTEVDQLLREAEATSSFTKKQKIYKDLHSILAHESPYTFLWTLLHHAAHSERLSNVEVDPFSFFKHISSWKIAKGEANELQ